MKNIIQMKFFLKVFVISILSLPILWFFINVIFGEKFFYPKPEVDTVFADDYDEEKFNGIRPGFDTTIVINLLGRPLSIQNLGNSEKLWYYTTDGKCQIFDFAWLVREVYFSNDGKVIKTTKPIHED